MENEMADYLFQMGEKIAEMKARPNNSDTVESYISGQELIHSLVTQEFNKRQMAEQDEEAVWTKALNDAFAIWESKNNEGSFPLLVTNHLRANYFLTPKTTT